MNKLIILSLFLETALVARSYVYLDLEALYLQRGGSTRKVLVNQGTASPYTTVISSKKLVHQLGWEPAVRVSVGASSDTSGGFFRALVASDWKGHKQSSLGNLNFPFINSSYATGYYGASSAYADYKSSLAIIDGYFTKDFTPLWENYFAVRGFLGLQYFNIPEKSSVTFYTAQTNTYEAKTNNNLGLASLGLMFQIRPSPQLAMEIIALGGVGGNYFTSKTNLYIANNTALLRNSHQVGAGAGYSFMGTVRAVYRPVNVFEIGLGYELIYAGGVAFPYKQMSDDTSPTSDDRVHHNSSLWYQGASLRIGFKL